MVVKARNVTSAGCVSKILEGLAGASYALSFSGVDLMASASENE